MEQYFGTTGQVLGLDPFYYEDSDVSTFDIGNISQQHFAAQISPSSPSCPTKYPDVDIFGQTDDAILEDLLTQGESLLDQLLDNETDCSSMIDLSNVDELCHLFPNEKSTLKEAILEEALSPVPTLPSEPSSPLDLENLISWEPEPLVEQSTPNAAEENLAAMLQDLSYSMLPDVGMSSSSSMEDFSESFSSTEPTSPNSSELSLITNSDVSFEQTPSDAGKVKTKRKARPPKPKTPYAKLPVVKKERKKRQNKEAANRYRQKKKEESLTLGQQEGELLEVNSQFKSDVENLERQIRCIKDLLSDVFNVNSF